MAKKSQANAGDARDAGLIPELGRSAGGGNGSPLQCSCLGNPMDRGAWQVTAHEVTKSRAQLITHTHILLGMGNFHFSRRKLNILSKKVIK